jgi:hypothetical protein
MRTLAIGPTGLNPAGGAGVAVGSSVAVGDGLGLGLGLGVAVALGIGDLVAELLPQPVTATAMIRPARPRGARRLLRRRPSFRELMLILLVPSDWFEFEGYRTAQAEMASDHRLRFTPVLWFGCTVQWGGSSLRGLRSPCVINPAEEERMLADRNINRPSYVLALLLGLVALADAANALVRMQALDPCSGLARVSSVNCGTNAGWFVDLMSSAICATLVVFLLLRPHLYVFAPVAVWSFVAFMANFFMKSKGLDVLATGRMAFYFLVFVGAGVLLVITASPGLR